MRDIANYKSINKLEGVLHGFSRNKFLSNLILVNLLLKFFMQTKKYI